MAATDGVGWSLASTSCPAGTAACETGLFCCPSSLTCVNSGDAIAEACCLSEIDCVGPLELAPTCADPSWSLWTFRANIQSFNYFCCLEGQIGLTSGECGLPLLLGPPPTNIAVPVTTTSSATSTHVIDTSFSSFTPPTSRPTFTPPTSISTYTPPTSISTYTPPTSISTYTPGAPSSPTPGSTTTSASPSTATGKSGGPSVRNMLQVGLVVQAAVFAIFLSQF